MKLNYLTDSFQGFAFFIIIAGSVPYGKVESLFALLGRVLSRHMLCYLQSANTSGIFKNKRYAGILYNKDTLWIIPAASFVRYNKIPSFRLLVTLGNHGFVQIIELSLF